MNPDIRVPQQGKNAFSEEIFCLSDLISDAEIEGCIRSGLRMIFDGIGLSDEVQNVVVERCIQDTKRSTDLLSFEKNLYTFLSSKDVFAQLPQKTAGRADRMAEMLLPFAVNGTVLDLGCGPGGVGALFAKAGHETTLADVYENPSIQRLGLPFTLLHQDADFPFANQHFDNVLILAMLHHTTDPLHTIRETNRILRPNGRLHLIETVYGVDANDLPKNPTEQDKSFAALSPEQQRKATMFFDYFGNHVTWYYTEDPTKYVPVPFNFNIPSKWLDIFSNEGFVNIEKRPLGTDPASGVFHYLFIFERK